MRFHPVRPGHCPCCQVPCVAPENGVEWAGCWDGRAEGDTKTITGGGSIFAINCVACGCVLHCHAPGKWDSWLTNTALWYAHGSRYLIGGDRWRGRPQTCSPEQVDSLVTRFQNLLETSKEIEEAVLILHTTSGIGAISLIAVIANVLCISTAEAKKLVVNSLSPFTHEQDG